MPEVKIQLAAGTNVGLIRQNNEDNFVVSCDLSTSEWLIPQTSDYIDLGEYGALLAVADGMGGANAGEVASATAIETIQTYFVPEKLAKALSDDDSIQDFMKSVVKEADLNILKVSKDDPTKEGMGTTIVIAWLWGDKAYICWCGDSRCYVFNKRIGLIRLSKDHSYVQELIDKGELDPEYASDHPLSNIVTRCLGDVESRSNPESRVYQLHHGDIIMLCSDGLCGLCYDEQIMDTMATFHDNPTECKNELISIALANGGYDNVTVALCLIQKEGEEEEEQEEDNIASTVRTGVITRRLRFGLKVLSILLRFLAIAACVYYLKFYQRAY